MERTKGTVAEKQVSFLRLKSSLAPRCSKYLLRLSCDGAVSKVCRRIRQPSVLLVLCSASGPPGWMNLFRRLPYLKPASYSTVYRCRTDDR